MATTTTNLGLTKPATSDNVDITVINGNMDKLDIAVAGIQNSLAIIANGNTHAAIASGQYVYVRNHSSLSEGLYNATSAIAANATLSTSNLTAVSGGGLNILAERYNTRNSYITATSLSQFESTLNTVCQTLSPGEFKFVYALPNWSGSFTGGAGSLAIVHQQNTAGLYNCFILFGGAQGYYYNSAWHWQKPAQTAI